MRNQHSPVTTSGNPSGIPSNRAEESPSAHSNSVEQALHQARTLHRASRDCALLQAMPALRRAHNAGVFHGLSLSAPFGQRHLLQRKHFLHALAVEAGFTNWESSVQNLRMQPPQAARQHGTALDYGYPNLWFSTHEQAEYFAEKCGGRVVFHGRQAMVVPLDASPTEPTRADVIRSIHQ